MVFVTCGEQVVIVQSLNRVQLFATPWTTAHQAPLSSTISLSFLKFISIETVILTDQVINLKSQLNSMIPLLKVRRASIISSS